MGLLREVCPVHVLALVLALALAAAPSLARADADLVVTRGDGATGCPDAAEVRRLALSAMAPSVPPPAHAYHVSFERSGASYRAEIVDDTAARARRLEDLGPGCAPLGQAAAQVVVTMWSSEGDDAGPAPSPRPAPVTQPTEASVASQARPRKPSWVFGAGPAVAVAIVRPAAPALVGDGAAELAHVSLGLGGLWIPAQRIGVAPGSIDVQLIAGSLRACAFSGTDTRVGLCARAFAGALRAEGNGYSTDARRTRPWVAIEPEVYVGRSILRWVRGRAAVGVVVPLRAETFSVTGAGAAYATPIAGGVASLSIEIVTP